MPCALHLFVGLCVDFSLRRNDEKQHAVLLNLDHFKVVLARAALRTGPVHWHVVPQGARLNAVFWPARFFVVDPAADQAHVLFHKTRTWVLAIKPINCR